MFLCVLLILVFSATGVAQLDTSIYDRIVPLRGPDITESMKRALEIKRMQLEIEAKQQEMNRKAAESAARSSAPSQPTVAPTNSVAVDRYAMPPGGTMENLVQQCEINRPATPVNAMELGQCFGYFTGTVNSLSFLGAGLSKGDSPICLPRTGISANQALKIFQKWASEHPQWLNEDAGIHVVLSLMDAFPCAATSKPDSSNSKPEAK
jgi:hypothetical protein